MTGSIFGIKNDLSESIQQKLKKLNFEELKFPFKKFMNVGRWQENHEDSKLILFASRRSVNHKVEICILIGVFRTFQIFQNSHLVGERFWFLSSAEHIMEGRGAYFHIMGRCTFHQWRLALHWEKINADAQLDKRGKKKLRFIKRKKNWRGDAFFLYSDFSLNFHFWTLRVCNI